MKTKKKLLVLAVLLMVHIAVHADEWIRINQMGYLPQSIKVAVFMSEEGTQLSQFQLVDAYTEKVVRTFHHLKETGILGNMKSTYRLNFSDYNTPGVYYLKAGCAVSPRFPINAQVYQQTTREFIIDAYSTEKEVNLTLESFEQNEFLETKFVEDKIISTFTLTEDAPRVERILLSNGENISVVTAFAKDAEIVLEGIANIGTIYYSEDDDGNKVLNSVVIDVPYSLSVQAPLVKSGYNFEVDVSLGEVIVKNKKGRELEVIANINISYNINRPSVFAISTEINFGEQKQEKDYALEIYVAKENQTLWDIAKYLNISQENLLNQNPEVVLPLNAGDKLVAYHGGKNIE